MAERQRKEEREASERHDQLLCDMEKAKLELEKERINSQQFQQERDYEFKCQLQEKQHEDEFEKLEAHTERKVQFTNPLKASSKIWNRRGLHCFAYIHIWFV